MKIILLLKKKQNFKLSFHFLVVGWLGYSTEKVKKLCQYYLDLGFNAFKVKVGLNLEEDKKRCAMIRECIGPSNVLVGK